MQWVIAQNAARTETLCTLKKNWDEHEYNRVDVDGNPMIIEKEFEAESWEAAKKGPERTLRVVRCPATSNSISILAGTTCAGNATGRSSQLKPLRQQSKTTLFWTTAVGVVSSTNLACTGVVVRVLPEKGSATTLGFVIRASRQVEDFQLTGVESSLTPRDRKRKNNGSRTIHARCSDSSDVLGLLEGQAR